MLKAARSAHQNIAALDQHVRRGSHPLAANCQCRCKREKKRAFYLLSFGCNEARLPLTEKIVSMSRSVSI